MTNYSPHTCPLWLFRSGKDTYEIAAILRITQAEVERRIHILRSHEKRKPARFDRHGEQAA